MLGGSFVRISSLLWADIWVGYAFFVMQNYLTDVWGLSFTHSAAIMNIYGGVLLILPGFFLLFKDEFLGNFMTLVLSSIAYTVGIGLVSMSTPPVLGNCKQYESNCIGHTQKVLFYTGMALVALGAAGNKVSIKPFLEEQNPSGQQSSNGFQILGFSIVVFIPIVGAIALPYIKSWALRFGIPAICTLVATLLFLSGSCGYEKNESQGSPIINVCRVYVACASKTCLPRPIDNARLYRENDQELLTQTRFLRCLEKAAINITPEGQERNKWRVCSVAEVEEAKIAIRMIPMWLTFIVCGIVSSMRNTYFVEQAKNMNRKIGVWNLPPQILLLFYGCFKGGIFDNVAGWFLSSRNTSTTNRSGIKSVFGIGIAMVFSILCCATAAGIEIWRLNVIRNHGLLDKPNDDIPMSIYLLLFQFFLLAGLDSFFEKSVAEFYKCQAPESMENYLEYFAKGVTGLGFMFSVLSVYVVDRIRPSWFQFTLNRSRLDRYYWVLAVLCAGNLVIFIVVASFYRYKNREAREVAGPEARAETEPGGENGEGTICSCF